MTPLVDAPSLLLAEVGAVLFPILHFREIRHGYSNRDVHVPERA